MKIQGKFFGIVPAAIVIIGVEEYMRLGKNFYDALLLSLKLLKVELGPLPPSILLEIARWLGIIFFFSLIYSAITIFVRSGIVVFRTKRDDAVAVHGDSPYASVLLKALGRRGVKSDSSLVFKAPVQVILFARDEDSIAFYQKNADKLRKAREVHLCLNLPIKPRAESDKLFVTNISEIRAIGYWREHYCEHSERIALIGSGPQAEAVLYWSLLTNINDDKTGSEYHVYGDFGRFRAIYDNIPEMIASYGGERISFYDKWYSDTEFIRSADRVILCGDTNSNIENAALMSEMGISCPMHLFAENVSVSLMAGGNVSVVGTLTEKNACEMLLMDEMHKAGKICHASYMLISSAGEGSHVTHDDVLRFAETPEFADSWKRLDAFTRSSNYAAAIHDPVKYILLVQEGISPGESDDLSRAYDGLSQQIKDRLQEIEHIRWCRFHFLNHWKAPADGSRVKDRKNRTHPSLVAYDKLSREEKDKDSFFYRTLPLRYRKEEEADNAGIHL